MKNLVRAFVVFLALTGAASFTHESAAQKNGVRITPTKTSAFPIPSCPPDDPHACGMGGEPTD